MNDNTTAASGSLRFDPQASEYDDRTGLPNGIPQQIAQCIAVETQAKSSTSLLELAAGTGELGVELTEHFQYEALEGSVGMLNEFRLRLDKHSTNAELHLADVNQTWPIADGSQDIIFIARAAHLFQQQHLLNELSRCGNETSLLMLARVNKGKNSVANILRKQLHLYLSDANYQPKQGQRVHQQLLAQLDPNHWSFTAAQWFIETSPAKIIQSWRSKPGLAGIMLKTPEQDKILDQLEHFAAARFEDLQSVIREPRVYQIGCARIHC